MTVRLRFIRKLDFLHGHLLMGGAGLEKTHLQIIISPINMMAHQYQGPVAMGTITVHTVFTAVKKSRNRLRFQPTHSAANI